MPWRSESASASTRSSCRLRRRYRTSAKLTTGRPLVLHVARVLAGLPARCPWPGPGCSVTLPQEDRSNSATSRTCGRETSPNCAFLGTLPPSDESNHRATKTAPASEISTLGPPFWSPDFSGYRGGVGSPKRIPCRCRLSWGYRAEDERSLKARLASRAATAFFARATLCFLVMLLAAVWRPSIRP